MPRRRRARRRRSRRRSTTRCRPALNAPRTRPVAVLAHRRAEAKVGDVLATACRSRRTRCGVSNEPVVSRLTWPENGGVGKEVRRHAGRRGHAPEEVDGNEGAAVAAAVGQQIVGNRDVLQDAAPRVADAPGRFPVVVGIGFLRLRRTRAPRSARHRRRRSPPAIRRSPRRGPSSRRPGAVPASTSIGRSY